MTPVQTPWSSPVGLTLYTFAMSHYSEKVRWTLDVSQLPYREVCLSPGFHILPALRMGGRGQTTLPILRSPVQSMQDSPRILAWLSRHHGPLQVMPLAHEADLQAAMRRFDAIGKDVARLLYHHAFGHSDAQIIKLWTDHASPWQARFIRLAYPVMRWVFRRKLHIHAQRVAQARHRIEAQLDWLEAQLSANQRFLVADTFTVADITAASLLAPLACPEQHPVYGDAGYRQGMAGVVQDWAHRPAMAWVRRMYSEQRGAMRGGMF